MFLSPYRRNMNTPINPFNALDEFIDGFFGSSLVPTIHSQYQMRVDVKETDTEYIVEAEIPGFVKEDIAVELREGNLRITAEKKEQKEESKDKYLLKERKSCKISRSFHVGNVKQEDIKAKHENGVLTVTIPKKAEEQSNKISIE